jgi:hypothetical protein
MLPPALHGVDRRAPQTREVSRWEAAALRRMQRLHAAHGLAHNGRANEPCGELDLR